MAGKTVISGKDIGPGEEASFETKKSYVTVRDSTIFGGGTSITVKFKSRYGGTIRHELSEGQWRWFGPFFKPIIVKRERI